MVPRKGHEPASSRPTTLTSAVRVQLTRYFAAKTHEPRVSLRFVRTLRAILVAGSVTATLAACSASRPATPPRSASANHNQPVATQSTPAASPGLRVIPSCPVTVDEVSKLVGQPVTSSVTAASVAKELAESPHSILQDIYLGDGLSATVIASIDPSDPRPSLRNECAWQTGSDDDPGLQISLTVISGPLVESLGENDDLEQLAAGAPSQVPGLPTDVHEVTSSERSDFSTYTTIGSGAAAVSITVDLIDATNRTRSETFQVPGRTIIKAAIADVGRH